MQEQPHHIDKLISDKLRSLEVGAPPEAWDAIQAGIQEHGKRSILFYWPWAAAVAVLLFVSLIWLIPNPAVDSQLAMNEPTKSNSQEQVHADRMAHQDIRPQMQIQDQRSNKKLVINPTVDKSEKSGHIAIEKENSKKTVLKNQSRATAQTEQASNIQPHFSQAPQKISPFTAKSFNYLLTAGRESTVSPALDTWKAQKAEEWRITANQLEQQLSNEQPTLINVQGSVSPVYSFRSAVKNTNDPYYTLGGGPENLSEEQAMLAYSGGVTVGVKKNRLQISTGLYYLQEGQVISNFYINKVVSGPQNSTIFAATSLGNLRIDQNNSRIDSKLPEDIPPEDLLSANALPTGAKLYQQFEFVEIPLIASYSLVNKKLDIALSGGLSTHLLVGNLIVFKHENEKYELGPVQNINRINYNSLMGLEFSYPFSDRIRFRFQPLFRYALNPLNKSYTVSYIPYSFSLYTGLNYRF